MKNIKRIIAIAVSTVMLMSAATVAPFSVSAAETVRQREEAATQPASSAAETVSVTQPAEPAEKKPEKPKKAAEPVGAAAAQEPVEATAPHDTVGAAYSADWREWSQGASDDGRMRQYGCWVTAQSKMLTELGIASAAGFNPDVYMQWEFDNGFLDDGFYQTNGRESAIVYASQQGKSLGYVHDIENPSADELMGYINSGYYVILQVNSYHYVYVNNQKSLETGTPYYFQSWSDQVTAPTQSLAEHYPNPVYGYVYSYSNGSNPTNPTQPVTPEEDTYEKSMRYVPNYVLNGNSAQPLFNPATMQMMMDMSAWAYDLQDDYHSWNNRVASKYGYTQFDKVIDGGVIEIGEYQTEEEFTDASGEVHTETVTKKKFLSAVNAGVALKPVNVNGSTKYTVAIAFRGTVDPEDWLADFTFIPNSNGIHSGFASNAARFYEATRSIHFDVGNKCMTLYDMIQDMKQPDSDYRLLVTGHSLGAALADVFVGECLYTDGICNGNVMAYTFAAPKSISSRRELANILNFINSEDPVTRVGGSYHIGTDIVYQPDDAFRQNYGNRTFAAHRCPTSYRPLTRLLCAVDENGMAAIDPYMRFHTNGNVSLDPDVTLNRNTYNRFAGNVVFSNLTFANASVIIGGNMSVKYLGMTNADDYLLVGGNFEHRENSCNLTNGTVEIKGDFKDLPTSPSYSYREGGEHKTILSGNKRQTVSGTETQFANLYLQNTDVAFATNMNYVRLAADAHLAGNLTVQYLYLNGHTLSVDGNVNITANSTENFFANSVLNVNGDFLVNNLYFNATRIAVGGNMSVKYLGMTNADDYLLVGGNFEHRENSCNLTNGTVEIKGDFTDLSSSPSYSYREAGEHKTILSGNEQQTVSGTETQFANLYLQNTDVAFATSIYFVSLATDAHIAGDFTVQYLHLNGHTLTVEGDTVISGRLFADNSTLHAKKNLNVHQLGESGDTPVSKNIVADGNCSMDFLYMSGASIAVGGNMSVKYLGMTNADDYLLVGGNFEHRENSCNLTNGTVEIKGDFKDLPTSPSYSYREGGEHKTILSGNKRQTVSGTETQFANLYLQNTDVAFATSIYFVSLAADAHLVGNLTVQYLYLNGHTLSVDGNVNITANSTENFFSNSVLNVNGDFLVNDLYFNATRIAVGGNMSVGKLGMTNADDYLLVGGNFEHRENSCNLTNGTVEIKGDFKDLPTSSAYCYREGGEHKTILSGNEQQTVSGTSTQFARLILLNKSGDGTVFENPLHVSTLFNHNHCHFTLGDNGSNSTFNDYDGDGIKDHLDPLPLDPDPPVTGDANLDGTVNINDATALQRHIAETEIMTGFQLPYADANGDGTVDIADVTHLQMYLAECDVILG